MTTFRASFAHIISLAWKSVCYKLLSSLLTSRLSIFLESMGVIPDEQHGFRRDHSTATASRILLEDVHRVLANPKGTMTAVFVDLRSAFDTCPRDTVLTFLAEVGVPQNILRLLFCILQENRIVIDDGVSLLPGFSQTTGYAQGDNLSPLLFSVLLKDLPRETYGVWQNVKIILYADDLLLYGRSPIHVQDALVRLGLAVKRLGLTVNSDKTVAMRFRNGGRVPGDASLSLEGKPIAYVNKFVYLGLYMSFNARCFTWHIKDRCRKALLAAATIKKPQLLSVCTAMQLFDIKVLPTATFAIELIWEKLTAENLECLNKCKASFIKKVLGLHSTARNRLVYLLADTTLPTEDMLRRFNLPQNPSLQRDDGKVGTKENGN